jgi:hypothetical protein
VKLIKTLAAAGAAIAVIAVAGVVLGVIRPPFTGKSPSLPCEQLSDRVTVEQALAQHADLVDRIHGAAPAAKVTVSTPCAGQPDKALITIRYTTADEQAAIDTIMRRDSFGVPAELINA